MQRLNKVFSLVLLLLLIGVVAVCAPALASAAEAKRDVYKNGDVIKWIIPFSAGGGYDKIARMMIPFLQDELKNITGAKVDIIVENLTGGAGVPGNSAIYRARPDGKTFGMIGTAGAPYLQLVFGGYDLSKYTALAIISEEPIIFVVAENSKLNSLEDAINFSQIERNLRLGTAGKGGIEHISALMTQNFLAESGKKLNASYVHYPGTSDILLAILKGEVDGAVMSHGTAIMPIRNGDLKGIALYARERVSTTPDVPTLYELNVQNADKYIEAMGGPNRVLVAPPDVPDNIASVMKEAIYNVLHNGEFKRLAVASDYQISGGDAAVTHEFLRNRLVIAQQNEILIKQAFE